MSLRALHRRFGHHIQPLAHLFGSSSLAVFLPIITAPINSRLYAPEAFGVFALAVAIASILTVPYIAGFSRIIMLADDEGGAASSFQTLSATLAVPCLIVGAACLLSLLFGPHAGKLAVLVLVIFSLTSFSSLATAWLVYNSKFKELSISRICQGVAAAAISICLGLVGGGLFGILLGHTFGLFVGIVVVLRYLPSFRPRFHGSVGDLMLAVKSNRSLFLTSLPAEGLNTVTHTLPTFLFSAFAGPAFVGVFNMANRLLELPASLLTSALSQYFQALAIKRNQAGQSILPLVLAYSFTLLIAGSPFFIIGTIFAPDLASWALGEKWRAAGEVSRYLSLYVFLRVIVSPVTFVVFLRRAFFVSLVMDIGLFVLVGAGLFVSLYFVRDPYLAVACFTAVYSLSYVISFALSCYYARRICPDT